MARLAEGGGRGGLTTTAVPPGDGCIPMWDAGFGRRRGNRSPSPPVRSMIGAVSRPRKPPIDKKDARARLEHARDEQLLVNVRRWIPQSDRVEGFVVAIGERWVALQRLSDRIVFDGWAMLRLKDIQAVSIEPDPDSFEVRALRVREQWPPTAPRVDLDRTESLIATAASVAPMVTVFDDFSRPDACWIGSVVSVDERMLRLLEVSTRGGWERKPRTFSPADITRVDIGGGYEEALHLVAGPPPRVRVPAATRR